MKLVKNCDNCDVTYNRMRADCIYCEFNPESIVDNFQQKLPKLNGEFTVEIPDIKKILDTDYSWDIAVIEDGEDERKLVIYLPNMILSVKLSKALNMLSWETCKARVAEHWNLSQ